MSDCLKSTRVYRSGVVAIDDVRCRPHNSGCSAEECSSGCEIAFTRAGMFVRHVGSRQTVVDPNHVLFFSPSEPYRISHPAGGDDCTSLRFAPDVLLDACRALDPAVEDRPDRPFRSALGPAGPATFLHAHRLRRQIFARSIDSLAADESAIELLDEVLRDFHRARGALKPAERVATRQAHRRWVDAARVELGRRFSERLSLADISRSVHCSAFHLARIFQRQTGLPLHRYVNRLRLRAALERLGEARDLTTLALDLGFSSHSHFTTAFRLEFGQVPAAIRRDFTSARRREMSKILKA